MKKSLIALAALGAFAGAASAQSSVTLFGILDTGVRAVRNDGFGTVKSVTNDGLSSSRLGFRGEEDLGGGLKAGFWIESGVGLDVGTAGTTATAGPAAGGVATTQAVKFFNRRSTISLISPYGEVRMGRDYTPTFSNLSAFDSYGAVGVGNVLNLFGGAGNLTGVGVLGSGAGTIVRADNTVAYVLPSNLGGVYGTIQGAAGENSAATNGNNRYVGGRIGYAAGPVNVAAAYGKTRIPGNNDFRVWNLGGSFDFGVAKVSAIYHRGDYTPTGAPSQISHRLYAIGANVPLGQGEFRATYQKSDLNGGVAVGLRDQDDARQYAIGYIYNLSKRTAVYADLGKLQNRGGSVLTIPGNGNGVNAGGDSTAFALGVRHSF